MPIVITHCDHCGDLIEIDTHSAVVLTGNAESLWREIRRNYRTGEAINVQMVADMAFISKSSAYNILKRLVFLKLITRHRVRRYYHYYVSSTIQKSKKTA